MSVKARSKNGERLNPRKADLHRWRETFAEKLRERGIDAEASRQATRGVYRNQEPLWRIKAREDARLRTDRAPTRTGTTPRSSRGESLEAWKRIAVALGNSDIARDRMLAEQVVDFVRGVPLVRKVATPEPRLQGAIQARVVGAAARAVARP
ncbi:MAG TPA: hypothetical protein VGK95_08870 [Caldimonas sp.]